VDHVAQHELADFARRHTGARDGRRGNQRGQFAGLLVFSDPPKLPMAARAADTR
jgi:hypothetical protein